MVHFGLRPFFGNDKKKLHRFTIEVNQKPKSRKSQIIIISLQIGKVLINLLFLVHSGVFIISVLTCKYQAMLQDLYFIAHHGSFLFYFTSSKSK